MINRMHAEYAKMNCTYNLLIRNERYIQASLRKAPYVRKMMLLWANNDFKITGVCC